MKYVALLRGINVGGKNPIAMTTLAALFAAAGCEGVTTYIQSGNVLFEATTAVARGVGPKVMAAIEKQLGLKIPVILRTQTQLASVLESNPFVGRRVDPEQLHVMFLADTPRAGRVRALDFQRSPPDEYEVVGREIYLRCPNGVARTKLTNAYFDETLSTISSGRNWRTVQKLDALLKEAAS